MDTFTPTLVPPPVVSRFRIGLGSPLTVFIAVGCILGTYTPGASMLGIQGNIFSIMNPWTWLCLFTWPLVHANTSHLIGNMMLFLLLAPRLEQTQGKFRFLMCLAITSIVIGVGHLLIGAPNTILVGASGWVFMLMLLSTFTGDVGFISVPTIVVAILYATQELKAIFTPNHISQFAHLLGGVCGFVMGLWGMAKPKDFPKEVAP